MNPGLLGERQVCYLCAMQPTYLRNVTLISKSFYHPFRPEAFELNLADPSPAAADSAQMSPPNVSRFRFPVDRDPPTRVLLLLLLRRQSIVLRQKCVKKRQETRSQSSNCFGVKKNDEFWKKRIISNDF